VWFSGTVVEKIFVCGPIDAGNVAVPAFEKLAVLAVAIIYII
jgi:hypothetical protein